MTGTTNNGVITLNGSSPNGIVEPNFTWSDTTGILNINSDVTSTVINVTSNASSGIASSEIRLIGNTAGFARIGYGKTASTQKIEVFNYLTSNSNITISSDDNVGIGTITPTRKLDVSGDYKFVHNPSTELSVAGAYGDIVTFGSGTGFTTGGLYYYATSGIWTLADASSVAASSGLLSIALGATPSSGMLLRGYAKYTGTSYTSMTLGGIQYISGTAGSFTETTPSVTGDVVRIIGYCIDITNDILYFNPSNDWIEI